VEAGSRAGGAGSLEAAARGIPAGSPAGHIPEKSIYHIAFK